MSCGLETIGAGEFTSAKILSDLVCDNLEATVGVYDLNTVLHSLVRLDDPD
jgi:hypothetical protein